jgi:hypothetical protein
MYCPHCGAVTRDDHAFCHACGAVLPGPRHLMSQPRPALLSMVGDPGVRMLALALGGLVAVLLISEVVKAVLGLALPLLIIIVVVYWARERRRRYY